jgi:hypothetical protein
VLSLIAKLRFSVSAFFLVAAMWNATAAAAATQKSRCGKDWMNDPGCAKPAADTALLAPAAAKQKPPAPAPDKPKPPRCGDDWMNDPGCAIFELLN